MIVWVEDDTEGRTILRGYDAKLRPVVVMREIDNGERWSIEHYKETHVIKAYGCPDPVKFVMRLISPRNEATNDQAPLLRYENFTTKETIEVWDVV